MSLEYHSMFAVTSNKKNLRKPNSIDTIIGINLKTYRKKLRLAKINLAAYLNISLQQLNKYERGVNRISATRLWEVSQLFKIPMDKFFKL